MEYPRSSTSRAACRPRLAGRGASRAGRRSGTSGGGPCDGRNLLAGVLGQLLQRSSGWGPSLKPSDTVERCPHRRGVEVDPGDARARRTSPAARVEHRPGEAPAAVAVVGDHRLDVAVAPGRVAGPGHPLRRPCRCRRRPGPSPASRRPRRRRSRPTAMPPAERGPSPPRRRRRHVDPHRLEHDPAEPDQLVDVVDRRPPHRARPVIGSRAYHPPPWPTTDFSSARSSTRDPRAHRRAGASRPRRPHHPRRDRRHDRLGQDRPGHRPARGGAPRRASPCSPSTRRATSPTSTSCSRPSTPRRSSRGSSPAPTRRRWPRPGRRGWPGGASAPSDLQRLRDAGAVTVYTPGSTAGVPLNLIGAIHRPPDGTDPETVAEEIEGTVSGLLGLVGIEADPLVDARAHPPRQPRPPRLGPGRGHRPRRPRRPGARRRRSASSACSTSTTFIPEKAPQGARHQAQRPPGVADGGGVVGRATPLDIDGHAPARGPRRPARRRRRSPSPTSATRSASSSSPCVLGELVTWMRRQPGTDRLRALLYFDEVLGFVPPVANPPAKPPMLRIFKQARAFGLGAVLATQNPVDLDYKAHRQRRHLGDRPAPDRAGQGPAARRDAGGRRRRRPRRRLVDHLGPGQAGVRAAPGGHGRRRRSSPRGGRCRTSGARSPASSSVACPAPTPAPPRAAPAPAAPPSAAPAAIADPAAPAGRTRRRDAGRPAGRRRRRSGGWRRRRRGPPTSARCRRAPASSPALALRGTLTYDDRAIEGGAHREEWEAVVTARSAPASTRARLHVVDHDDRDFLDAAPAGATYVLARGRPRRRAHRREAAPGRGRPPRRRPAPRGVGEPGAEAGQPTRRDRPRRSPPGARRPPRTRPTGTPPSCGRKYQARLRREQRPGRRRPRARSTRAEATVNTKPLERAGRRGRLGARRPLRRPAAGPARSPARCPRRASRRQASAEAEDRLRRRPRPPRRPAGRHRRAGGRSRRRAHRPGRRRGTPTAAAVEQVDVPLEKQRRGDQRRLRALGAGG